MSDSDEDIPSLVSIDFEAMSKGVPKKETTRKENEVRGKGKGLPDSESDEEMPGLIGINELSSKVKDAIKTRTKKKVGVAKADSDDDMPELVPFSQVKAAADAKKKAAGSSSSSFAFSVGSTEKVSKAKSVAAKKRAAAEQPSKNTFDNVVTNMAANLARAFSGGSNNTGKSAAADDVFSSLTNTEPAPADGKAAKKSRTSPSKSGEVATGGGGDKEKEKEKEEEPQEMPMNECDEHVDTWRITESESDSDSEDCEFECTCSSCTARRRHAAIRSERRMKADKGRELRRIARRTEWERRRLLTQSRESTRGSRAMKFSKVPTGTRVKVETVLGSGSFKYEEEHVQHLCAMTRFSVKSAEELRFEDYCNSTRRPHLKVVKAELDLAFDARDGERVANQCMEAEDALMKEYTKTIGLQAWEAYEKGKEIYDAEVAKKSAANAEQLAKALKLFQRALETDSWEGAAHTSACYAYLARIYQKNHSEKAIELFQHAIRLKKWNARLHLELAEHRLAVAEAAGLDPMLKESGCGSLESAMMSINVAFQIDPSLFTGSSSPANRDNTGTRFKWIEHHSTYKPKNRECIFSKKGQRHQVDFDKMWIELPPSTEYDTRLQNASNPPVRCSADGDSPKQKHAVAVAVKIFKAAETLCGWEKAVDVADRAKTAYSHPGYIYAHVYEMINQAITLGAGGGEEFNYYCSRGILRYVFCYTIVLPIYLVL
jgi:tetratricopeptide (TPR) repeat protein